MSARSDIDALIAKADVEFRTTEKSKRTDFAGVTAMAGLTILARHIDALVDRLDGIERSRTGDSSDPGADLAELRRTLGELSERVGRGDALS